MVDDVEMENATVSSNGEAEIDAAGKKQNNHLNERKFEMSKLRKVNANVISCELVWDGNIKSASIKIKFILENNGNGLLELNPNEFDYSSFFEVFGLNGNDYLNIDSVVDKYCCVWFDESNGKGKYLTNLMDDSIVFDVDDTAYYDNIETAKD